MILEMSLHSPDTCGTVCQNQIATQDIPCFGDIGYLCKFMHAVESVASEEDDAVLDADFATF